MRYAQIRTLDISNGEGVGVALFTQGCPFHCKGCFNTETWDYNGGKPFSDIEKKQILEVINQNFITRFSILGGEPCIENNAKDLLDLVTSIKEKRSDIKIWLYSGNTFERLYNSAWQLVLQYVDVLVDGPYIEEKKDWNLKFRGSSNQRVIDIQKSLQAEKAVLYLE